MKERMMSIQSNTQLHDHILDGFFTSHQGLRMLLDKKLITTEEYTRLLEENAMRLAERVKHFRITHKLTSIVFALLFSWLQIGGEELEMRRVARRTRRRNEDVDMLIKN